MEARPKGWSGSPFSPAAPRQTSVALLRNVGTGDHRVVTSVSTRRARAAAAHSAAAAAPPPPPPARLLASPPPTPRRHPARTATACRKSTEVLRINLRSGRLELENDAWSESSYENEVRRGPAGCCRLGACFLLAALRRLPYAAAIAS